VGKGLFNRQERLLRGSGAGCSTHFPNPAPVIFKPAIFSLAAFDAAIGEIGQAVYLSAIKSRAAIIQAMTPFFIFAQRDIRRPDCSLMVIHDALPAPSLSEIHYGKAIAATSIVSDKVEASGIWSKL